MPPWCRRGRSIPSGSELVRSASGTCTAPRSISSPTSSGSAARRTSAISGISAASARFSTSLCSCASSPCIHERRGGSSTRPCRRWQPQGVFSASGPPDAPQATTRSRLDPASERLGTDPLPASSGRVAGVWAHQALAAAPREIAGRRRDGGRRAQFEATVAPDCADGAAAAADGIRPPASSSTRTTAPAVTLIAPQSEPVSGAVCGSHRQERRRRFVRRAGPVVRRASSVRGEPRGSRLTAASRRPSGRGG